MPVSDHPGSPASHAPWRIALAHQLGEAPSRPLVIRILAPGVWRKRKRLKALLGPEVSLRFGQAGKAHAVAGWGLKGGGRAHAKAKGLPYLALEDAFLATLGEQRHGYGQLGLIADPVGIYYDARQPSFSEQLIQDSASVPETDDDRHLMAMLREHRLGKFNSLDPDDLNYADDVHDYDAIVVDQIAGDLSIEGGLADSGTFTTMLTAAIDTHGAKGVAVKLHPYDGYGGRRGHLAELAQRYGLAVLPKRAPWMAFAERASRVYVVSSNAGLEALIAGASVTTFGVPFYGGYGLTDDHQAIERRTSKPSPGQLCRAVYQEYGRYWLPGLERQGTVQEFGRQVIATQRHARLFACGVHVLGVPKLKRSHIAPFADTVGAHLSVSPKMDDTAPQGRVKAIWASKALKRKAAGSFTPPPDCLYAEDGFIRSVGLGADLIRPCSLVFDQQGIYFDPSQPSDLEWALQNRDLSDEQRQRGALLADVLKKKRINKYNVGQSDLSLNSEGRRVILVPGQVEDDASVLLGSGDIRSNGVLLEAVRSEHPDAYILYKPHPDVELAGRPGALRDAEALADRVLRDCSAYTAINACDAIYTMTSLIGFEGLIQGKEIRTYGLPFYAGWGLTSDTLTSPRRTRTRTLPEMVYLTLVDYPLYISPLNGKACDVGSVIEILGALKKGQPSLPLARQALRFWRKSKAFLDYLK